VAALEDLTRGAVVRGVLPEALVTVVDVQWYGSSAIELTYSYYGGEVKYTQRYQLGQLLSRTTRNFLLMLRCHSGA